MEVRFRTKKLEKWFVRSQAAIKDLGPQLAKRYIERINLIKGVTDLSELAGLPGLRCHRLRQNRSGQWAIRLDDYMRLIFTIVKESPEVVVIQEVSKHYGD